MAARLGEDDVVNKILRRRYGIKCPLHPLIWLKRWLMNLSLLISRILVLVFIGLIGYSLAGSLAVKSAMGVILALISLIATVLFFCLLPKLHTQRGE